ncbi:MAG: HDOD domain-containing protein [Deltaproteobacteria bacterium]|jgi:HD-like signal output (HDOD) protein|nr:HDOD domain-containing protein [Deltaproteobacteria bacterium]
MAPREGKTPDSRLDPQVAHRLKELSLLVSLPQITVRLIQLISQPNSSLQELRGVVERDPALTAKVISLANSTYYSLRNPTKTVERAITIIGFQELGLLALGLGLTETFNVSLAPKGFDVESLWIHSLAVSWVSQRLANKLKSVESGEAMIAGLLHEIGTIVLVSKFPLLFQRLLDLILAGRPGLEAESVLKIRHEIVGHELASLWKLPEGYQEAILCHHNPELAGRYKVLAAMVALADVLAHKIGFGLPTEVCEVDLGYSLKTLGLTPGDLQEFIRETIVAAKDILPLWRQLLKTGEPTTTQKSRFSALIPEKS